MARPPWLWPRRLDSCGVAAPQIILLAAVLRVTRWWWCVSLWRRWGIGPDADLLDRVDMLVGFAACVPLGTDDARTALTYARANNRHAVAARIQLELDRVERKSRQLRWVWLVGVRVLQKAADAAAASETAAGHTAPGRVHGSAPRGNSTGAASGSSRKRRQPAS